MNSRGLTLIELLFCVTVLALIAYAVPPAIRIHDDIAKVSR